MNKEMMKNVKLGSNRTGWTGWVLLQNVLPTKAKVRAHSNYCVRLKTCRRPILRQPDIPDSRSKISWYMLSSNLAVAKFGYLAFFGMNRTFRIHSVKS